MKMNQEKPNNDKLKNEELIKQLELIAGRRIEIIVTATSDENLFKIGEEKKGILKNDVKMGSPILFEDGNTTDEVKNIGKMDGKILIQTARVVYELKVSK